ncbi:MAG: type II toxin-antitoxin system VapC family toxin [Sulfuricaulis sp.]|uniref:type II toxin-antitoxin system VapC family toxin n=1 Tax=Sulfuricaulis sp. TaxID=2003553 RepID=UPI0034A53CEA
MPDKVIDASAMAALVFGEPEADEIGDRIRGVNLHAPVLIDFEVASVCLKKLRQYSKQRAALLAGHALAKQMAVQKHSVDTQEIVLLAEQAKLTAYDAAYLWLAGSLRAELVTLDKRLSRVAKSLIR